MKQTTQDIATLGVLLALITLLDWSSRVFRIFPTVNGGSFSLTPTVLLIAGILVKPSRAFLFGVIVSIITFIIGSQWFINVPQYLFDYPIALGGAIMIASISWRMFKDVPLYFRAFLSMLLSITWQFVCYTIALFLYINSPKMFIPGISTNLWTNMKVLIAFNGIYMLPILLGNIIIAPIVVGRLKRYLIK